MIKVSKEQLIHLHESLIRTFGGSLGIRDDFLLDLCLDSPFQTFDGKDLYPDIIKKVAHIGYALVKYHPFIDGNKRIGAHLTLVLLELNGFSLDYSQEELIRVILGIADSSLNETQWQKWIYEHLV